MLANVLIGLLIVKSFVEYVVLCLHVPSGWWMRIVQTHSRVAARARRTDAGETCAACDVTRQTIIALEAGKYSPSLELAFRLARALGRDLDDVFEYEEKK